MILAHSLGGMVARTSVLLSNFPRRDVVSGAGVGGQGANGEGDLGCGVSDIIMLSTPNNRCVQFNSADEKYGDEHAPTA